MPFINNLILGITNLRTKVGDKLNSLYKDIGIKGNLTTANKDNIVGAVNEINSKFVPYEGSVKDIDINDKSIKNINDLDTRTIKISTLNGMLKSINGVVTTATPQVDYLTNVDLSAYATQSWVNSQGFLKSIPIATSTVLGGIKVGANLTITADGTLSAVGTKYTAGNGLTLTDNEFSLPITQSGTGSIINSVTQTANGIIVTKSNLSFSEITNKPTTVSGYGITDAMVINDNNLVNADWGIRGENYTSIYFPSSTLAGVCIGSGGIVSRYTGNGIFPDNMVPSAAYKFQNLYFPQSKDKSRLEDRVLVTSVNNIIADINGNVNIPSGGVDPSKFLLKDSQNTVTKDFTINQPFSIPSQNPHGFNMSSNVSGVVPVFEMGINDSNGEGVTLRFLQDRLTIRGWEGTDESMVMDGNKISFEKYAPNKLANDLAQIKDLENLKQWVIDNFLSLNGGVVNGNINANSFKENL